MILNILISISQAYSRTIIKHKNRLMPQVNLQRDKEVQCRKNQFHDPDKFNNNLKKHNKQKAIQKNALSFATSDKRKGMKGDFIQQPTIKVI